MNGLQIIPLFSLGLAAVLGTFLNATTTWVLARDTTLKKNLGSVRWLMFGESASGLLVCCLGAPLLFANILVGAAPPFSTIPFICYAVALISSGTGYVAFWYQTEIALTRLAAVMTPAWYRNHLKKRFVIVILMVFPWFMAYIEYFVGALVHAYDIHPSGGPGSCEPNEYDETPEASARYATFRTMDSLLHAWIPMPLGLICYVVLYLNKWLKTRTKNLVKPIKDAASSAAPSPAATEAHAHLKRSMEERDKKIRLLAIAYAVNMCLVFPDTGIVYPSPMDSYVSHNLPILDQALDVGRFATFLVSPIIYAAVSADFWQAYKKLWRCG